jgi:hypothetical protein
MTKINTEPPLEIPAYAKVKVYWDDTPVNYSKEGKVKVRNYFANKYGLNKNNVNVVYRPVKYSENGDVIEITGAGIDNIMDVNYQRALMKEIIARDGKTVDFNRIIALDDKVNGELNVDLSATQHRTWAIKWLMVDNFLSFGENNFVPFSKIRGLTVVNSVPPNQGGKTTLTIDAIKFLLHGSTTKTDKNEQIFNLYSGKDALIVRGMISIEDDELIIERKLKRSLKKSGGGWTVNNTVNYYKVLPDGSEELQNEEDAKQTTKSLREAIGSEKDFELLVLATEKNLDDLIGLTTTESGKVLTRLIGLEILELKEDAARKMHNEFSKKKKSNQYDVITLTDDIITHNEKIVTNTELEGILVEKLATTKNEITAHSVENDRLLNSKQKIDINIVSLDPSKLESEILIIKEKGVDLKSKISDFTDKINGIGVIKFDEDRHLELSKEIAVNNTEIALKVNDIYRLEATINDLIAGGVCKSCNRKLDTVDNTEHIKTHRKEVDKKVAEKLLLISDRDNVLSVEWATLANVKSLVDEKNRLELAKDRTEVEIGSLRNKLVSKMNDIKQYNLNVGAIELNQKIDSEVSMVKTNLAVCEYAKDDTLIRIQRVQNELKDHKLNIETKTLLIETIKKEEEIDKIFKVYVELVGKKGISKLVLRSVLPIINSELQRLLDDTCDFEVEIFIDDKNDVQFLINDDGVSRPLKSASGLEKTAASLALRGVLGKISTLPMPNFITFDEVLGKIAPENIDKLKSLFDKIKDMYDIVFLITHNDLVKDWGDNVLTVVKEGHISKVTVK